MALGKGRGSLFGRLTASFRVKLLVPGVTLVTSEASGAAEASDAAEASAMQALQKSIKELPGELQKVEEEIEELKVSIKAIMEKEHYVRELVLALQLQLGGLQLQLGGLQLQLATLLKQENLLYEWREQERQGAVAAAQARGEAAETSAASEPVKVWADGVGRSIAQRLESAGSGEHEALQTKKSQ